MGVTAPKVELSPLQRRVADFAAKSLQPDERIEALLPEALSGLPWPLALLLVAVPAAIGYYMGTAAISGILGAGAVGGIAGGAIAFILFAVVARSLAVVVTDRRVLVVKKSALTSRPTALLHAYERSAVKVAKFGSGRVFGTLRLEIAGERDLTLSIRRWVFGSAGQVVAALGGTPTA